MPRLAGKYGVRYCRGNTALPASQRQDRRSRAPLCPNGKVGMQDKLVMTRFEREKWDIAAGGPVRVFDTVFGRIGISICYDVEFPLIARAQAEAGATIILAPPAPIRCRVVGAFASGPRPERSRTSASWHKRPRSAWRPGRPVLDETTARPAFFFARWRRAGRRRACARPCSGWANGPMAISIRARGALAHGRQCPAFRALAGKDRRPRFPARSSA